MAQTTPVEGAGFSGLGIIPQIMSQLEKAQFIKPTAIQAAAIPLGIAGQDLIGVAETGTGKTLAFGIPMIQKFSHQRGCGLVLVPTRELALQVEKTLFQFSRPLNMRTAVIIGGASMGPQKMALRKNPHMIIGTPGRLQDHLNQRTLRLDQVTMLVLDEADRMLDMGFAPAIAEIIKHVSKQRQTLMFSATMPSHVTQLAQRYLNNPKRIDVSPPGSAGTSIDHHYVLVSSADSKRHFLEKLLKEHRGTVLVFSRTKFGARKICHLLQTLGHRAAEIHSNRSLAQRREALEGFKAGKYRVLVATDIASRGIDVENIQLVVNYDLPNNVQDYVHRIGRTGRAGRTGKAISLVTHVEQRDIRQIEKTIRRPLKVITLSAN